MSTHNPNTTTYPVELKLATSGASLHLETLKRVERVEQTAADQATVTLGTGVILLLQILSDVERRGREFVRVTVRDGHRETPLRDSAGPIVSRGDDWTAFLFTAITRYDEYVTRLQCIDLENHISQAAIDVLRMLVTEGELDVHVISPVWVTLTDRTTLSRVHVTISGERDARNELVIRQYLYDLLTSSYGVSVRHESQIEITYDRWFSSRR